MAFVTDIESIDEVFDLRKYWPHRLPDDLSVTEAAKVLGVDRPALPNLLNEKASLSPEMALHVEKVFAVRMDTLLRMQVRYDAWQMRQRKGDIVGRPYEAA